MDFNGQYVDSVQIGTDSKSGMTLKERVGFSKKRFREFLEKYPCSLFCYEDITVFTNQSVIKISMTAAQMFALIQENDEATGQGTFFLAVNGKTLKKAVSGSGSSDKSIMIKEVLLNWNFNTNSDDIADAFGCAKVGQAIKDVKDIYLKLLKATDKPFDKFLLDFDNMRGDDLMESLIESGISKHMFESVVSLMNSERQAKENDNDFYQKKRKVIKAS
jgi:Holliday junction resolvasome RuvABC endonuclease subunit